MVTIWNEGMGDAVNEYRDVQVGVQDDVTDRVDAAMLLHAVRAAAGRTGGRVYLGGGDNGWAWAGLDRSTLVLGPSRSGKTSSLVIPNILAAPGAVVTTSTKPDVLLATAGARSRLGPALLYDPSGTIDPPPGVTRIGWSPVSSSATWDTALLTANAMVQSARGDARARSNASLDDHWTERASALLAPLLFAASCSDAPMSTVLRWVDRHHGVDALEILATSPTNESATDLLAGILSTDAREQSGIWSTASGALGAYRSHAARASTLAPYFDADAFCGATSTLYICASGRRQHALAPLVVGMLGEIRDAAYRRAAAGSARPPVLMAIDEATNIAPVPDLPTMVSEGPGQGLLTLVCLQDLSQARARWGSQAEGFVSLFGTTVVLRGIADIATLEVLSALAGEEEIPTRTVGTAQGNDGRPHPSTSISTVRRRRLAVDEIARGWPGLALALDAHNQLGWVRLSPAHTSAPWRRLVHLEPERVAERRRTLDPGRSGPSNSIMGR